MPNMVEKAGLTGFTFRWPNVGKFLKNLSCIIMITPTATKYTLLFEELDDGFHVYCPELDQAFGQFGADKYEGDVGFMVPMYIESFIKAALHDYIFG